MEHGLFSLMRHMMIYIPIKKLCFPGNGSVLIPSPGMPGMMPCMGGMGGNMPGNTMPMGGMPGLGLSPSCRSCSI